jgi:putative ABC transport system substrate-binding protein
MGFVEGRNLAIEYREAEDHYERLPALAADLVRRKVAVIVAVSSVRTALAARRRRRFPSSLPLAATRLSLVSWQA